MRGAEKLGNSGTSRSLTELFFGVAVGFSAFFQPIKKVRGYIDEWVVMVAKWRWQSGEVVGGAESLCVRHCKIGIVDDHCVHGTTVKPG